MTLTAQRLLVTKPGVSVDAPMFYEDDFISASGIHLELDLMIRPESGFVPLAH